MIQNGSLRAVRSYAVFRCGDTHPFSSVSCWLSKLCRFSSPVGVKPPASMFVSICAHPAPTSSAGDFVSMPAAMSSCTRASAALTYSWSHPRRLLSCPRSDTSSERAATERRRPPAAAGGGGLG